MFLRQVHLYEVKGDYVTNARLGQLLSIRQGSGENGKRAVSTRAVLVMADHTIDGLCSAINRRLLRSPLSSGLSLQ